MRNGTLVLVLLVALITTACGGAAGTAQLAAIISSFADGVGDTNGAAPATVYDITKVVSRRQDNSPFGSYDTIQVELTFAQPPVLPATGSPTGTQMAFDLGFDTDQDTSTGGTLGCGPLGFWAGWDFLVAGEGGGAPSDRLANGNYNVIDSTLAVTGQATVSVSGNVMTVNVPMAAFGGDDGQSHLQVFAANRNGGPLTTTDCAPDPTGSVITGGTLQHGVRR